MHKDCWSVVEWSAWDGFLVRHALPAARRVPVRPNRPLKGEGSFGAPQLFHINLTRPRLAFPDLDEWLARAAEQGPAVCNGYCDSIDKWAVQAACVAAGLPVTRAAPAGDPDEPLVVKMRANHWGKHDRLLDSAQLGALAPPPWPYPERIRVLLRSRMDPAVWKTPGLTVERFVSNPAGSFHRAYVVGRYVAAATSRADGHVKEMDHRPGVEFRSSFDATSLPAADRDPLSVAFRLAREMRADYAAIDLAIDSDGIAHAIDLNTTPWWGDDTNPRLTDELATAFAILAQTGSLYASPASAR